MYFYRGVCRKTTQNLISRLMFWCLGVLSFKRVKNSYLICPLSKNSIHLWETFFLVLNMRAKIVKKIQPLCHFSGLTLEKKLRFCTVQLKIKINHNLAKMLRNFIDTSIKIHIEDLQSSVTFRISLNIFYFFDQNTQNHNWCSEPNLNTAKPAVVNCSWKLTVVNYGRKD